MANAVYPKYLKACIDGDPNTNLISGNVKAALVHTGTGGYTYNAAHEFVSDLTGIVARTGNAGTKSATDSGAFESGTVQATAVTGSEVDAVVLYVDSGADSSSRLVVYYDTGVTGLPITPSGQNLNVTPDATGWFTM